MRGGHSSFPIGSALRRLGRRDEPLPNFRPRLDESLDDIASAQKIHISKVRHYHFKDWVV
jgi:hypothetical protein